MRNFLNGFVLGLQSDGGQMENVVKTLEDVTKTERDAWMINKIESLEQPYQAAELETDIKNLINHQLRGLSLKELTQVARLISDYRQGRIVNVK